MLEARALLKESTRADMKGDVEAAQRLGAKAANGGGQGGGTGFFPLPFFVGAMAMGGGGRFEIGLKTKAGVRAEEGQRALKQ